MVYLPRSSNNTCSLHPAARFEEIQECKVAGNTPYCSPLNGTRICSGYAKTIPFAWSPSFYNPSPSTFIYIDFGDQHTQGAIAPGGIPASRGAIDLRGFRSYAKRISNSSSSNEMSLKLTIREWYPYLDSMREIVHEGPTLILVTPESTATATPSATPAPDGADFPPGKIAGITFGGLLGAIFLLMILFSCCKSCCLSCCCKGRSEEERVRRQQVRRVAQERAVVQPEVDAIKTSAAQGMIWTGPVRPGGVWATDMPRRALRPARIRNERSDEMRAVAVVEDQRNEEQRVEQRRQEIRRGEESEPPVYEAPPPKYTP